jgi:hypothetical protein
VNWLNCEILFTRQAVSSSQQASNIVFADISLGLLSLANKDNLYKLHIFEKNSRSPNIMSKIQNYDCKNKIFLQKPGGVEIVAQ